MMENLTWRRAKRGNDFIHRHKRIYFNVGKDGAREVVTTLNEYFSDMIDIVFKQMGRLINYWGRINGIIWSPLIWRQRYAKSR